MTALCSIMITEGQLALGVGILGLLVVCVTLWRLERRWAYRRHCLRRIGL